MRLCVSELDPALVPVGPLEAVVVGHFDGALAGRHARLLVLVRAPSEEEALSSDLVLLIEGSQFAFRRCVYLRCIQCHLVHKTLDAPKINATFEGKFRTLI